MLLTTTSLLGDFSPDSGSLSYFSPFLWSHRYHSVIFHTAQLNCLHKHFTAIAQLFQLSFRLVLVICTLQSNQNNISSRDKCICQEIRQRIRFTASSGVDRLRGGIHVIQIHLCKIQPF